MKKKNSATKSAVMPRRATFEYTFLATLTMVLLAVGVVMVFSASWASAYLSGGDGDGYLYLKKELLFGAIGLALMFGLARHDFTRLRKAAPVLMVIALILLAAVFIPGVGVTAKGATRWIKIGPLTFQPSELAKLAIIVYVATVMYKRPRLLANIKSLALPVLGLPVLACILVLLEPDMGTTITIVLAITGMLVIGGIKMRHLGLMGGGAMLVAVGYILKEPYRIERVITFLDPWRDPGDAGFQIIQSMVALGSGGVFGVGIGQSIQKFNYLPEAHTDMILAIIGEEVGLLGVLGVVFLFAAFAYAGFRIALNCDNLFGKYLAAGITSLMVGQAAVNLCAVTGLLPLTGIPLPIISYGGSSLVVILASVGILLNISVNPRKKIAKVPDRKLKALKGGDSGGRHGGTPGAGAGYRRRAQVQGR